MAAGGIAVRPVERSPLRAPFVLAAKGNQVALFDRRAFREVNVVGDEQRVVAVNADDEALVAIALGVVGEHLVHAARGFDDDAGLFIGEGLIDGGGAGGDGRALEVLDDECGDSEQNAADESGGGDGLLLIHGARSVPRAGGLCRARERL